jgi:hypothetical protein
MRSSGSAMNLIFKFIRSDRRQGLSTPSSEAIRSIGVYLKTRCAHLRGIGTEIPIIVLLYCKPVDSPIER